MMLELPGRVKCPRLLSVRTRCEILGFTDRFSEALASAYHVVSLIFMV